MIAAPSRLAWLLCLALACSSGEAAAPTSTLAIRDVTLWDGTGAPPSGHRTVVVREDRIVEVEAVVVRGRLLERAELDSILGG
jgi:hypothetical protein